MSRIKYTTKELKRPDRFRRFLAESLESLSEQFNKILLGTGILVVAFAALFFISSKDEKKNIEANRQFAMAVSSSEDVKMADALEHLEIIRTEHNNTDVSVLALYHKGMIHYELGNFEKSIANLELFLAEDTEDSVLRTAANLVIGLSSFAIENWEKSKEHLSEVNDNSSPYYTQARRHLGLIYEKTGDRKTAEKILLETTRQR